MDLSSRMVGLFLVTFVVSLCTRGAHAQNRTWRPFGVQRSYSDPNFNRNNTSFHRHSSFSRRDHCTTNYKFDFVKLSLLWAPGDCSTSPQECKREVNTHMTVHGMWPTINGREGPNDCCFDNVFDYRAIQPLLPLLNEYWFSYYDSSDNRRFWSHEWLKHGTCARDIPTLRGELNYFGTTVKLAKQMPILDILKKSNIVPNNTKAYDSKDIIAALNPLAQGKTFQIDCDYEHSQPIPVLKGLNFCFDVNIKPTDCPEMKRRCQRQVIIPVSSKRTSILWFV